MVTELLLFGMIILGLAGWLFLGLSVEGPLVLLGEVLPSKLPIWGMIVVIVHLVLLFGCIPLVILLTPYGYTEEFYQLYFLLLRFDGIELILLGSIAGLLSYIGARIWRLQIWKGPNEYFLLPLHITLCIGLVFSGWALLSVGIVYTLFRTVGG